MGKYLKVFSFYTIIYFIILSILIILTELTFGYWLDEYNFGPEMRGKRIQKIIINNNSKNNQSCFQVWLDIFYLLFHALVYPTDHD